MTYKTYIFEPELAKSKALARLVNKEKSRVVFVASNNKELRNAVDSNIGNVVLWSEIKHAINSIVESDKFVLVPTGIDSTKLVLDESRLMRPSLLANDIAGTHDSRHLISISQTVLDVCNKPWLLERAGECGVPTPKTWKHQNDIPDDAFPIFYKEEFEAGGGIRGIAKTKDNLPTEHGEQLIYQEYIDSVGTYGVAFWAENGAIVTSVSHFEQFSYPTTGGSAITMEEFDSIKLLNHAKTLLRHINYTGWGLVEFKLNPKTNDFVLMEINSKVWASVEFSVLNNSLLGEQILGQKINNNLLPEHRKILFFDNFCLLGREIKLAHIKALFTHDIITYDGIFVGIKRLLSNLVTGKKEGH